MERSRFQGVKNIIGFNRHFYVSGIVVAVTAVLCARWISGGRYLYAGLGTAVLVVAAIGLSLLVSFYIYDLSGLYRLNWLEDGGCGSMVNIHAGFDETSAALARKFPGRELKVFDFYDPCKHMEVSIARARKVYPAYPGTVGVGTEALPLADGSVDLVCLIFAAHEIRNKEERVGFFRELRRVLKPAGQIIVVEHLRDWPNFLAYTIGFFHFLPSAEWEETYSRAGWAAWGRRKINPFITVYTLGKDGSIS